MSLNPNKKTVLMHKYIFFSIRLGIVSNLYLNWDTGKLALRPFIRWHAPCVLFFNLLRPSQKQTQLLYISRLPRSIAPNSRLRLWHIMQVTKEWTYQTLCKYPTIQRITAGKMKGGKVLIKWDNALKFVKWQSQDIYKWWSLSLGV